MSARGTLKRLLSFLVPVLLLVAVILLFLRMQDHKEITHAKSARDANQPIPVDVIKVAGGEIALNLPTECTAQANPLVRISNPMPGRPVARTLVAIGSPVNAGQPLLEVDARAESIALKNAQEQVQTVESYVLAERDRAEYFKRVRAEGLGLERDARQAFVEYARATVELATARATLRQSEAELQRTRVSSPAKGVVLGVAQPGEIEFGRMVGDTSDRTGGGAVVAVGVIDPIMVECELPESKLTFLRAGQPIGASFPSLPGERFEGTLFQIRPGARQDQRTVSIAIQLPNPKQRLLPGVHGLVQVQERWSGLRVPSVALVNPRADAAQVFVVDAQNKARLRRITIGGDGEGWVQVIDGLKQDEQVVVIGQVNLEEGDTVRIGRVVEMPGAAPATATSGAASAPPVAAAGSSASAGGAAPTAAPAPAPAPAATPTTSTPASAPAK